MMDEMDVDGKIYVSSKRAAEEFNYTQDYIGQLARGGQIKAKQSGGLWYVDMNSVRDHKISAGEYTPKLTRKAVAPQRVESVVNFDGEEYISSSRGAKITGYNQDYVTQLARSGKILSRRIGNRWYVSKNELIENKKHNDALLASVQAESVGLREAKVNPRDSLANDAPSLNYYSENSDLMPQVKEKILAEPSNNEIKDVKNAHNITIHVHDRGRVQDSVTALKKDPDVEISQHVLDLDDTEIKKPHRVTHGLKFALAGATMTVFIAIAVGVGVYLPSNEGFTRTTSKESKNTGKNDVQTASVVVAKIQSYVLNILSNGVQYRR